MGSFNSQQMFNFYQLFIIGGYAFSQEENGAVNQADLIRVYNTEVNKPTGV
jgi:hypothetical protein